MYTFDEMIKLVKWGVFWLLIISLLIVIVLMVALKNGRVTDLSQVSSSLRDSFLEQENIPDCQDDVDIFTGKVSPIILYNGLKFREIKYPVEVEAELCSNDFHYNDEVIDGYTFIGKKGDTLDFLAEENSNHLGSFISTELYGWGPTVVRMGTRIGWQVPVTTRYFYVVKGGDFYGKNFTIDNEHYDGSKYGKYRLVITKRN